MREIFKSIQLRLLAILFLATALPLGRFDWPLWRDEASSVWFARLPGLQLRTALCDPHPPGYYVLLKGWLTLGQTEFWLRLPSLLGAVLAVALTYRLGRDVADRRRAWLAALLLGLHPLQSWYAGEVRMYALSQSMGVLLIWLGWRWLSRAKQGRVPGSTTAAYGLVGLIGLGLDYTVLLPFGLMQLGWLAFNRPQSRRWLSLHAIVLLAAGWLWTGQRQLQAFGHSYLPVLIAVRATQFGFELTPVSVTRLMWLSLPGLLLISLGLTWLWSRRPRDPTEHPLIRFVVIAGWLTLLLLAALPGVFTLKRQLIVLLPYLALLAAYGLARLPRPVGEIVAILGVGMTLLVLPGHTQEPWRAVVAGLMQPKGEQAGVIWVDELVVPAFDYYWRQQALEPNPSRWTPLFSRQLPALPDLAPQPGHSLWVVTIESIYYDLTALLPAEFHQNYQLLDTRHEAGIGIYHYRRRIEPAADQPVESALTQGNRWGQLLPSPLDTCQEATLGNAQK